MLSFAAALLPVPPTVDPTLSPPIIGKPLHSRAETVAFSGADRDAKIIVYVNGAEVATQLYDVLVAQAEAREYGALFLNYRQQQAERK